jgi:hypothetical protein
MEMLSFFKMERLDKIPPISDTVTIDNRWIALIAQYRIHGMQLLKFPL